MPKRKRAEPSAEASASSRTKKHRKNPITELLTTVQKDLATALRLAAGFERQKHSRRKKTAQTNKDEKGVARLEAEYAALKGMDMAVVAGQHLRKTIGKVKSLRESDAIPDEWKRAEASGGEKSAALLNVQGRLFKVQAVRAVVDELVEDLKEMVGASGAPGTEGGGKDNKNALGRKEKERKAEEDAAEDVSGDDSEALAAFDALIAAPSSAGEDSEDSLSDGHRPPSDRESESDLEEELEDAETEGQDATTIPFHDFSEEEGTASGASGTLSKAEVASGSELDSDEASIPIPKPKRKVAAEERPSKSAFIPSLSHAAYYSGTESEASDLDEDLAPKKKRRGQRARQKIWEQKYKDKAKHLQKPDRNAGWDPKKGAVGSDRRRGARGGRGPEKSGANDAPLGERKKKRDDTGTLHPSWAAAKAAKEKKVDTEPKGKKIIFD